MERQRAKANQKAALVAENLYELRFDPETVNLVLTKSRI